MQPHPSFVALAAGSILARPADDAAERTAGRGLNLSVEWATAAAGGSRVRVESSAEVAVLLVNNGARLRSSGGRVEAPARSVCITDPGGATILLPPSGTCVVVTSTPGERGAIPAGNSKEFRDFPAPPVEPTFRRTGSDGPTVHDLDALPADGATRRLQTDTIMLAFTEADGQRDRSALDPKLASSEIGSLAVRGTFVHHLRKPWGAAADDWRPDEHVAMYAPTLAVTPPGWIATTEWIGEEPHQLLEVFVPVPSDVRAAGGISNSSDYTEA